MNLLATRYAVLSNVKTVTLCYATQMTFNRIALVGQVVKGAVQMFICQHYWKNSHERRGLFSFTKPAEPTTRLVGHAYDGCCEHTDVSRESASFSSDNVVECMCMHIQYVMTCLMFR